jgi:hypothetical protein
MRNKKAIRFLVLNALMWGVMTVLLVLVPDVLEPSLGFEFSRAVGWAVACGVWVVVLESAWKERFGTFARFALQLLVWVSAAVVASWISDQARPWGWGG